MFFPQDANKGGLDVGEVSVNQCALFYPFECGHISPIHSPSFFLLFT